MCVALEHAQQNCDQFLKSATREQVRQAEISISKVRSLAEQLEKEFKVLETFAIQKRRQLTEGPFALTACGQARAIPAPSRSFPLLAPSMARSTRSPVRSTNPPPPSAANGTMADKLYEFTCGTLGSFSQRSISSRSSLK